MMSTWSCAELMNIHDIAGLNDITWSCAELMNIHDNRHSWINITWSCAELMNIHHMASWNLSPGAALKWNAPDQTCLSVSVNCPSPSIL